MLAHYMLAALWRLSCQRTLFEATGIERSHILTGLFTDTSVVGDNNDINVDQLPLDYDILEDVNYK